MTAANESIYDHNYHELTDAGRAFYLAKVKPTWPKARSFFFEGCRDLHGQMYVAERRALYEAIVSCKPKRVCEIGTFLGGGSTFFIASALAKNGAGQLVTMEANEQVHSVASEFYKRHLPELAPYVTFVHGSQPSSLTPHIDPDEGIDAVFLDGAESAEQTYSEYMFFLSHLRPGALLMAHDWDTEKQRIVRPILEASPEWTCQVHLSKPASVGFVVYVYRGP